MSDDFYRAFEERYYAPQNIIKQLRLQYLPFVQPLVEIHPGSQTFDLGCGRGEWLEIMTEIGLKPYGVDLDDGMLLACHEKFLPARKGDAIEHLKTLANESQLVVTAFHVVEHITFSELRTLVSEALRVLKPGGLLIMETPNPENITVATRNFYLDPTHQRPIPPQLLSFLTEYHKFAKTKVIRLQEDKSLAGKAWTSLRDVLSGVSPDYAVVAQKAADSFLLDCTSAAFAKEYGLTPDALIDDFDRQTMQAEARAAQAEARAAQAEARAAQAESRAAQAESRAAQADGASAQFAADLVALHQSTSWRITAPLRLAKDAMTAVFGSSQTRQQQGSGLKSLVKRTYFFTRRMGVKIIRRQITWLKRIVERSPLMVGIAKKIVDSSPRLKNCLARALGSSGQHIDTPKFQGVALTLELAALTPRARSLYRRLRQNVSPDEARP